MGVRPGELIIDDSTDNDILFPKGFGRGYVERDYNECPVEMLAPPSEIKLIPESEWSDRIKEKIATKSQLSDIRMTGKNGQMIPALDQNGHGYCWAYSTGGCVMMIRAVNNQPYVQLNPHSVAATIKNGKDEGGWCGLSAKFLRENGIASEEFWAKHSRDYRLFNDQAVKANMALHKVHEEWVDLTRNVYDQNLTRQMIATLLLNNIPVAGDFAWWGHSVCLLDLVEVERGDFGWRDLNSWTDGWGDKGMSVIRGEKTKTMGAVAIRSTVASAA